MIRPALLLLVLASSAYSQSTIVVPSGGDLQAALNASKYGDTIVLQRDAKYFAPTNDAFIWPSKAGCTGSSYVTITTEGWSHVGRVTQADAPRMAKLVARNGRGAIQILANSGCLKLKGIEVTNQSSGTQPEHVQDLLGSAGGGYSRTSKSAYFVIDQCYVHPQEDGLPTSDPNYHYRTASHGVAWNVADLSITNSRFSGFFGAYRSDPGVGIDSQAIAYSSGPGPLVVHNNYLDSWYSSILTGGADTDSDNYGTIASATSNSSFTVSISGGTAPVAGDMIAVANPGKEYSACKIQSVSGNTVTCVKPLGWNGLQNDGGPEAITPAPTPIAGQNVKWRGYVMDRITVTRNTFWIDPTFAQFWRTRTGNNPKGYVEFKNGDNILFEGNILDGYPTGVGFGMQNQSGSAPWSSMRNIILRSNLFRRFSYMFGPMSITGYARLTERGGNVLITNNLGYGTGGINDVNGNSSAFFTVSVGDGPFVVTHNTVIDPTGGFTQQFDRFTGTGTFKDNILFAKEYGNQCLVEPHITSCFSSVDSNKNLIVNNRNLSVPDILSYYWAGSTVVPDTSAVGFTDANNHNYRLLSTSPGYRAATDGKDIGVDIDQLNAALGGAVPPPTPTPTSSPTPTPTVTPSPSPTATPSPQPSPSPTPLPPTGQIVLSGKTFLSTDGSPFNYTTVVLSDANGTEIRRMQEQENSYSFTVPPGSYQIRVEQGGYNTSPSKIVLTNVSASTGGLSILNFTIGAEGSFPAGPVMCHPIACSSPTPTPPVPTPSPTPPPPSPTPTPPPTPTPSPTPTPVPICTMTAPAQVMIPRNGVMDITVTTSTGPQTINVQGSDGQVTVSPLSKTGSSPFIFKVRVKRQNRTISFISPSCGTKQTMVMIQ